jgi:hypothetical protein
MNSKIRFINIASTGKQDHDEFRVAPLKVVFLFSAGFII